jgi:tRNA-specific 2-thiouridylase
MKKKRVIVGMSGGVDSSVAALLLKEQGYDVVGLFMQNWEEEAGGYCTAKEDYEDVRSICAQIGIPVLSLNFAKEYKDNVFKDFIEGLQRGLTPNPDILCNREIKFKVFYEKAKSIGGDYMATGHYVRTDGQRLLKGVDPQKDQSYFLAAINPHVLKDVLFPVGEIHKSQVREIAKKNGLVTQNKKDSTGICFIGERKFHEFLKNFIPYTEGDFKTLEGDVVGQHRGCAYYTLGQRRHLGLGGAGSRWFVIEKDIKNNVVYVERDEHHPKLFKKELMAHNLNFINSPSSSSFEACAKVRYRQEDQKCFVYLKSDASAHVIFDRPQRAVTSGQYVVFYHEDHCLGGGFIA